MPDSLIASVGAPTFEHHRFAIGVGEDRPRLSWVTSAPAVWRQNGYEVEIDRGSERESSGRVDSTGSVLVAWPGIPLRSRERALVRVRVWGEDGSVSLWSEPGIVEAGLLHRADWVAQAIGAAWPEPETDPRRPPVLRRQFVIPGPVGRARLYATAQGVYEVEINGERVGSDVLAPGYTSYQYRLAYQTYDIATLLREGDNVIGVRLADGWYRGRFGPGINNYGTEIAFIGQLEIDVVGGDPLVIASDGTWSASVSGIVSSSLYDGEAFDAREEREDWSRPGREWTPVKVSPLPDAALVAPDGPPIRAIEEVAAVDSWVAASGAIIVDFGQNLVGRVRLTVSGAAGDAIRMRHAEVLENGELCVRTLRSAKATDTYTLRGGGTESWEPRFTLHGFRYVEVTGWPGEFDAASVTAVVHYTDLEPLGTFDSSDPLLDRLHENIVWSLRGNFVGIPTDCPQRDERYGWTGDIQLFSPTASFLYDCSGMLRSWLRDLALEQSAAGVVPWVVPAFGRDDHTGPDLYQPTALWADAAVLVPWTLYTQFGDPRILHDQYASAVAWVEAVERLTGDSHLWLTGHQFGDWLDPAAPPDAPDEATTDRYLVATAYHAHSARTLARIAQVLGIADDAHRFRRLGDEVAAAFRSRWGLPGGRLMSDTQTAYALALAFDLFDGEADARAAGDRLAELVELAGYRVATGLAGTAVLADALTAAGRVDAAYRVLLGRESPSWLSTVLRGATTIWERWDSMLPNGTVNPGEMTSFNHYALGAIGDWMHRVVAGLAPAEPGYRTIAFRPRPGGGLTRAAARHVTPYGPASIRWWVSGAALEVEVQVPTGATGVVVLPGEEARAVGAGIHRFRSTTAQ